MIYQGWDVLSTGWLECAIWWVIFRLQQAHEKCTNTDFSCLGYFTKSYMGYLSMIFEMCNSYQEVDKLSYIF